MKRQTLRSNSGCLSEIGTATFTHSLDLGLELLSVTAESYNRIDKKYDALYYDLTNQQVDQLNMFLKYKNRESLLKFKESVSSYQFDEFQQILDTYEKMQRVEERFRANQPKINEVLTSCQRRAWWDDYQRAKGLKNAAFEKMDSSLMSLSNEFLRTSREIQQRNFESRLLRSLEGIDSSLYRLR